MGKLGFSRTITKNNGLLNQSLINATTLKTLADNAIGRSGALLNVTAQNTTKLRTLLNLSGSGLQRGRIWCLGSSVEAGAGATAAGLYAANGKAKSRPMLIAKMLNAINGNTSSDYSCADSGSASIAAALAFDSRLSAGGGAATYVGVTTLGGNYIGLATNQTLSFNPGKVIDTAEIGYAITTGAAAQFTISVDGGTTALATITTNAGTTSYGFISQAITRGANTITVKSTGGGNVYIGMIGARDSTLPGIEVINGGFGGSLITGTSANNWNVNATGAGWGSVGAVNAIDTSIPNVFSLEAIINDVNTGASLANYISGETAWIQRCQAKGEVQYRIPPTVAQSGEAASFVDRNTFNAFADAARDNAIAQGCLVIDERILYPDWATTNALGLFRDGFHPNAGGYNASAQAFVSLCRGLN